MFYYFLFRGPIESSVILIEPAALSTTSSSWEGLGLEYKFSVILSYGGDFSTDGITSLNLATALLGRHLVKTFLPKGV